MWVYFCIGKSFTFSIIVHCNRSSWFYSRARIPIGNFRENGSLLPRYYIHSYSCLIVSILVTRIKIIHKTYLSNLRICHNISHMQFICWIKDFSGKYSCIIFPFLTLFTNEKIKLLCIKAFLRHYSYFTFKFFLIYFSVNVTSTRFYAFYSAIGVHFCNFFIARTPLDLFCCSFDF